MLCWRGRCHRFCVGSDFSCRRLSHAGSGSGRRESAGFPRRWLADCQVPAVHGQPGEGAWCGPGGGLENFPSATVARSRASATANRLPVVGVLVGLVGLVLVGFFKATLMMGGGMAGAIAEAIPRRGWSGRVFRVCQTRPDRTAGRGGASRMPKVPGRRCPGLGLLPWSGVTGRARTRGGTARSRCQGMLPLQILQTRVQKGSGRFPGDSPRNSCLPLRGTRVQERRTLI